MMNTSEEWQAEFGGNIVRPKLIRKDGGVTGGRFGGSGADMDWAQTSRIHKCKGAPGSTRTTLTKGAVLRLGKRQKMSNLNAMVKYWVESACG
jgi:hypothetical protein